MAKLGGTQDDLAVSLSLIFHLLLYSSFHLSRFENLTIMGGYWFHLSLAWPGSCSLRGFARFMIK